MPRDGDGRVDMMHFFRFPKACSTTIFVAHFHIKSSRKSLQKSEIQENKILKAGV